MNGVSCDGGLASKGIAKGMVFGHCERDEVIWDCERDGVRVLRKAGSDLGLRKQGWCSMGAIMALLPG